MPGGLAASSGSAPAPVGVVVASLYWMVGMLRDLPHGEVALRELIDHLEAKAARSYQD